MSIIHCKIPLNLQCKVLVYHILLDNNEVYNLTRKGYDIQRLAATLGADMNLMPIKLQEMQHMGYDFKVPIEPNPRFLKGIKA